VHKQEFVKRVSATKAWVRKWTEVYDAFEFMWVQRINGKQPWPHMQTKRVYCEIFRAIGIKYTKGRKVKIGRWLGREDDHMGYIVSPKR
jgi:hypothetical protein